MKTKFFIFLSLLILMITYVGWIFYISEPKYTDNPENDKYPKKYDMIIIENGSMDELAMVIQIDSTTYNDYHVMLVKETNNCYNEHQNITISHKGVLNIQWRIVGYGTFYHKVNSLIGFNIMMVTVIFVMIFCVIIFFTLIITLRDMLGSDFEFFWE